MAHRRAKLTVLGRQLLVDRIVVDSRAFAAALDEIGARHKRTRPFPPQTNGKAERFNQTLLREWA